jgi:hypothetical protein
MKGWKVPSETLMALLTWAAVPCSREPEGRGELGFSNGCA